jgi:anti-sigma B factor antagonist
MEGERMAVQPSTAVCDGVRLVHVEGEIDVANAGALRARLRAAVDDAGHDGVLVDLAQLTFLDARGLGSLMTGAAYAAHRHVPLTVVNTPAPVRRIMEITGTAETLGAS